MRLVVVVCFVLTVMFVMGGNNGEMKIREVRAHISEGSEKSSHKLKKIKMVNDYLISKWKKWFSSLDNDKDGTVGIADLESARNKINELHHLEAKKKKKIIELITKWWSEYVMWGKSEITEEEFVTFQNEAFQADKDKFLERMQRNEEIVGSIVDTNGDGFISEEECMIMLKAFGHGNEALDKKFFNTFKPVDGKILAKVLVDEWTVFLTSEDNSKPDVVKTAFEGGI